MENRTPETGMKKPDQTSDLTGQTCPYTVIGVKKALKPLKKGQVLEAIVDYRPAVMDSIPNFLKKINCPFTVAEVETGKWIFIIEKSDD